MISASRAWFLAFRTLCSMPRRVSIPDSCSEISTEIVPTSTGWPFSLASAMSSTTARYFASLVLKMKSFSSLRTIGRCVGIEMTSVL